MQKPMSGSVSGMILFISREFKHNCLTFIYSIYCQRTHLPSVTGSSFLSQGLPPAPYLGRNTKDLLSSKEAAPAVKSQEGENRKVRLVYSCQGLGLCHERSQVSPAHSHVRKLVHGCYDMPIDSAPLFPSPSSAPA